MCGTTDYLRILFPEMTAVGVDTHGSVLFGQPDGKRLLRGLGNSLMPKNLDHTVFDGVHWISAKDGFNATRQLHRRHALFMGPTSGAAYMVARWWAESHPDRLVVAIFPDEGYRYQDTIYNDVWLQENRLLREPLSSEPLQVESPRLAIDGWAHMKWGRRSYQQVMGDVFRPEVAA